MEILPVQQRASPHATTGENDAFRGSYAVNGIRRKKRFAGSLTRTLQSVLLIELFVSIRNLFSWSWIMRRRTFLKSSVASAGVMAGMPNLYPAAIAAEEAPRKQAILKLCSQEWIV